MEKKENGFYTLEEILPWGQIKAGTVIETPEILFPRIDTEKTASKAPVTKAKPFKPALKPGITIEDFAKIDLRAGTVISAEKIQKSNKLLRLIVDLGPEKRQVIAGIAKDYTPEEIVGRQVIVVANLKEARLMGEVSQGMILAAGHKNKLVLSGFDQDVVPGSPVK
jgi:methionyl-tRNA synthetase